MANTSGVNHAANLPSVTNNDINELIGVRLSDIMIMSIRHSLPMNMILSIDADVELCRTIVYLCESKQDIPNFSDSALDTGDHRHTIEPPKTVRFSGFCKGGFETKLSKEQLECINQSDVLRQWYASSINQAVEDGKTAIIARFYRHMVTNGVHPDNTGNDAGLETGGHVLGTRATPIKLTPDTVDDFLVELIGVAGQMPRASQVENQFGAGPGDLFVMTRPEIENLYLKSDKYNNYNIQGECGACSMMRDAMDVMPRKILHLTSYCVEGYVITNGGNSCVAYPVLFGRRYQGTKAAIRVDTMNYESLDKSSTFFKTSYYWHIHTYDCRDLGLAWVTFETTHPETTTCA